MAVTIKGKSGGLLEINISPSVSYNELKAALGQKLSRHKRFFEGADTTVTVSGKSFSSAQKQELMRLLHTDYNIENVIFDDEVQPQIDQAKAESPMQTVQQDDQNINLVSKSYLHAKCIFVSHTLRSGQRVDCEGDVVVLGDVNDGAEVIAGGSIAVMGTLRGLAHAGAMGRSDVVVAANCLVPKQLRISGRIAVFPAEQRGAEPEIAGYEDGSIVIRPLKSQTRKK